MASNPSTPSPSDSIVVGDLTHSVAAIGDGASVIYQQALSAADQAREQAEFEREELAKAVARRAEHLRDQANASPTIEGSPYKHLLHYELPDTARFFGRDETLSSLLDNLVCGDSRCRLLILHGDSGVGKTSLGHARTDSRPTPAPLRSSGYV
jgi:DNA replication protein DnaC